MIRYYSPNLTFCSLLKALLSRNADEKLISFFKELSGKEYILITNSCRTALYLAYSAIDVKGEVITNPLCCNIAFEPAIKAGNKLVYTDVDEKRLTMRTEDICRLINASTIAIQVNHLGGNLCRVDKIRKLIGDRVYIIEDRAQGLFSRYKGEKHFKESDIVCYSLIKNAYGIGGGILATSDHTFYQRACKLNRSFTGTSLVLTWFRILRNLVETNRENGFFEFLYRKLQNSRPGTNKERISLRRPSTIAKKISAVQLENTLLLNEMRKTKARLFLMKLINSGIRSFDLTEDEYESDFSKFLVTNPAFVSNEHIEYLNRKGIEAKHLEQKYEHFYQSRIDETGREELKSNITECRNYMNIYNSIISLPLIESITEKEMDTIIDELIKITKSEAHNMV